VSEKPIIFSTPMVQAVLNGRKTETRRLQGLERVNKNPDEWKHTGMCSKGDGVWSHTFAHIVTDELVICKPRYQIEDILYIRETWRVGTWRHYEEDEHGWPVKNNRIAIDYKASPEITHTPWCYPPEDVFKRLVKDSMEECALSNCEREASPVGRELDYVLYKWDAGNSPCRWRPSIHMPRWAARIFPAVTDVGYQRLQEISVNSVFKEGYEQLVPRYGDEEVREAAMGWFISLWNSTYPEHPWEKNPWVFIYTFRWC